MQEFEAYLTNKKIDAEGFKAAEPERWEEWLSLFLKVHPNSFSQQKLFLLNKMRRQFPLMEIPEGGEVTAATAAIKPKPKPKFKIPTKPKSEND